MDTAALPSRAAGYPMLMLLLVLSGLDQTVLSTALPGIAATLHGATLAPWVFTAYLLASPSVIPLYGKLADRWGVRRSDARFWATSDALMDAYQRWAPGEAGLLDLSRLENR